MSNRQWARARRTINLARVAGASARKAIETLEARQFFTSTPIQLSTSVNPYVQNWEDTSLIPANDTWTAQGFEGYFGTGLASAGAGSNPANILGTETTPVVKVNANQTSPSTYATGGPAEFQLTTAIGNTAGHTTGLGTVALQGSSGAVAPYLLAYLDTTGVKSINISYDLIDIDAGTTTSVQPVAVQYRIGNTGNFTTLSSVANAASTTGSDAGFTTQGTITLPATAEGQSLVQIRWITTDAAGSDQFIAIDNISIASTLVATTSPGTFNINSGTQAFTVNESDGTASIIVNRTGGTAGAVDIGYTLGGTATAPSDYTAPSGTVHFDDGQSTATIVIPIINDSAYEPAETITLALGTPSAGTLGTSTSATVTIAENDSGGVVNFVESVYSVDENTGVVTINLNRTGGSTGELSVLLSSSANPSATLGSDWQFVNGSTVTFADGQTSASVQVQIIDDSLAESDESFALTISGFANNTNNASIGTTATTTVTIRDNDTIITPPTGLLINEVFIDPPSTNTPYQYIELKGTPGQTLRNVYILAIEGDSAGTGQGFVDGVIDLNGAVIGSNGLLLVRSAAGFQAEDPASGVIDVPLFSGIDPNFGLEVGTMTLMLVYRDATSSSAAIPTVGTDLDTDNTASTTANVGVLEGLPSNLSLLDSLGVYDGGANDLVYSAKAGTFGTSITANAPAYFARLEDNTTANSGAAFYYAELVTDDQGNASNSKKLSTAANQRSANTPTDARATPGGYATPPTAVVSGVFNYAGAGPQSFTVTFNQNVSSSLAAGDFELINVASGNPVTLAIANVSADGTTVTLTFSNTSGATSSVLASGNYRLRVKAGEVGTLASNADYTFFFQTADFDHDRDVDFSDLLTLARNYNKTSGVTFSTGDADYDGDVDFSDLLALARNYNSTLAATVATADSSSSTTRTRTAFGASVIA